MQFCLTMDLDPVSVDLFIFHAIQCWLCLSIVHNQSFPIMVLIIPPCHDSRPECKNFILYHTHTPGHSASSLFYLFVTGREGGGGGGGVRKSKSIKFACRHLWMTPKSISDSYSYSYLAIFLVCGILCKCFSLLPLIKNGYSQCNA